MEIIHSVPEMQKLSEELRLSGKRIAVVPTMGFLHEGHLSLIRIAKRSADFVITTIFVNPAQFGPKEDFDKYPRDIERDIKLCELTGSDAIFSPAVSEIYARNYLTYVEVEKITEKLEGMSRPTHFRGVTTVAAKLFNITKPHVAVFGQKDAQQIVVIKKMTKDLNFDILIIVAPTVREPDGLAMSTRNVYLNTEDRKNASLLYKSLKLAEEKISKGERSVENLKKEMLGLFENKQNVTVDYISFTDLETLDEIENVTDTEILISLAVKVGTTRLIDNIIIGKKE